MSETFRRTKLERFVRRLEARIPVVSKERREVIIEIVAEIKQEFKLGEGKNGK